LNDSSAVESLRLSVLSDSGFGSITSVHDAVLTTTCAVPQTIPASDFYECDFRAHFCGSTHIDTVTGTLKDNENTTINQGSNSLQIDVSAVLHQPQP
jgi:hypothetical protein